ncbi:MAG: hypothetical protein GXO31_04940 [Epsilonproteobacteria bacterium]|nr:hypothetical protein [Campylobacterota bacterium]
MSLELFAVDWDYTHSFYLKKDQIARVKVDKGLSYKLAGELFFRWTLFVNEGLVVLLKYEGFPHQYVLYKKWGRDTIRLVIDKKPSKEWLESYLLIKFEDFDPKRKVAVLKVFVANPPKNLDVSFIDPKRK